MLNQSLYGRSLTLSMTLSLGISDVKERALTRGTEAAALQWDWQQVKEVFGFPG